MLKLGLVISIILFSVGCFNKKESNTSKAKVNQAELEAKSLKEKMSSEEANYESIVAEIETLKAEKRQLVDQNKAIEKAISKSTNKTSRDNYSIKYAVNKNVLAKVEDKIESKRLVASIAKQKENVAFFKYRVSLLDKNSSNYKNSKQSLEHALKIANDRINAYENEKSNLDKLSELRKKSVEVLAETGEVDKNLESEIKKFESELKTSQRARESRLADESTAVSRGLKQAKQNFDQNLKEAKASLDKNLKEAKKNLDENLNEAQKNIDEGIRSANKKANEIQTQVVEGMTKYSEVTKNRLKNAGEAIAEAFKSDKPKVYGLVTLKDLSLDDENAKERIVGEIDRLQMEYKKLDAEYPKIKEVKATYLKMLEDAGKKLSVLFGAVNVEKENKRVGYQGRVAAIEKEIDAVNHKVAGITTIFDHLDKHAEKVELDQEANSRLSNRLKEVEQYYWVKDAVNSRIEKLTKEFGESDPTKQDTAALKKYIQTIQFMLIEYKVRLENGGPHINFANQLLQFASTREPASIKKAK